MYVIVWEFRVKAGLEQDFEKAYASDGDWAKFFKQGSGYIKTRLLHDLNESGTYMTMDYWNSQNEYEMFKNKMQNEYNQLDKQFEKLTERETFIGTFTSRKDTSNEKTSSRN